MITFLIILGIVWIVCAIFNCWFLWHEEKDRAVQNGYISVSSSDLLMGILVFVAAPIVAAVFLRIIFEEDGEMFRINIRRK